MPFGVAEKLLIARDVTQLEAVARMRRDFIANVSHELKTPLTVISGFVETLQELDLDERQRARFLQLMHEQAASMQRLVEDLLTLSALESEHNPLTDEPFAIVPLLLQPVGGCARAVAWRSTTSARHRRRRHRARQPRRARERIRQSRLERDPLHARAAARSRSRWRIDADGSGVFSVTDTGIGIAAEHLPRLTERFYRVDRSRSRATGGTGLGLAIVKHVLLRHQAELEIASEPGKGSTFSVRLPARRVERGASRWLGSEASHAAANMPSH